MTEPTTPATSGGAGNTASEITKKLFSPVDSKGNISVETGIETSPSTTNTSTGAEAEKKEDRLKKEDTLVEQAKIETKTTVPSTKSLFGEQKKIDNEKINEIPMTAKEIIPEIKIKIEETTVIKEETPANTNKVTTLQESETIGKEKSELQKDMQIIANIQETKPGNTPVTTETIPAENVFNLDNLSIDIPVPKMIETGGSEPTKVKIPENPYDNLQKIIPQIMPAINKVGGAQNKNIGIGVVVILLLLGWFVIKTMYPIQYENTINGIVGGGDEESISAEIEPTPITGEIVGTGDESIPSIESGNILLDTGNTLVDGGILENLTGNEETIETNHNAAEGENQEIQAQDNTESVVDFKTKLETFVTQGKISLEEGKKTNNKEVIKYSTALYKKSESYLQNLANGEEITTDEMTNILTELGSYLVKVSPTTDANVSIGTETGETSIQGTGKEISNETTGNSIPQTETTGTITQHDSTTTSGGGAFDPDAFFKN